MHRRKIDVEGTTYRWCMTRDLRSVVVFPPKGGGPARTFPNWDLHDEDGYRFEPRTSPVTPHDVAGFIHRAFLGRRMPPRPAPESGRERTERREPPLPAWETSAEAPRVYVVTATLRAEGLPDARVPLETHLDPATAGRAVHLLSGTSEEIRGHYGNLREWDLKGRSWRRPVLRRRRKADDDVPAPGIEAWLDGALASGAAAVEVSFSAAAVPLRVPVERPGGWDGRARDAREVAGTLARIRA